MWQGSETLGPSERGRTSTGSEVVILEDQVLNQQAMASRGVPTVANLNVSHKSRVHLGPKFVTVTQNVHNSELIKGRFLGLELVSERARGLRCGVTVFVCWALVVAAALTLYLCQVLVPKQLTRFNIELPFHQYLWSVVKNTTRAERLACSGALILVTACVLLVVYFTVIAKKTDGAVDVAPHEWKITRDMWLAAGYNETEATAAYDPLRLVVVQHSVSPVCPMFVRCAAELRNLQSYFIKNLDYDIPYNFMIGNDGRVYEGRGWGLVGAHTKFFNRCSLGIGFIGDYRDEPEGTTKVTTAQMNRTRLLLEEGVRLGHLHPQYILVGAKDLQITESPGSNLYSAIHKLEHYDHQHRCSGLTCDQIYALPLNKTDI